MLICMYDTRIEKMSLVCCDLIVACMHNSSPWARHPSPGHSHIRTSIFQPKAEGLRATAKLFINSSGVDGLNRRSIEPPPHLSRVSLIGSPQVEVCHAGAKCGKLLVDRSRIRDDGSDESQLRTMEDGSDES